MMEIQIIQDLEDEYSDGEMAFDEEPTSMTAQRNYALPESGNRTTDTVKERNLIPSYSLQTNQESVVQDHFIDQVTNSQNVAQEVFSSIETATDGHGPVTSETQGVLSVLVGDGKSNVMMNNTLEDEAHKLSEKSYNADSPRYVIFSRTNQSSPAMTNVKKDSQPFAISVSAGNETDNFQSLPVNIDKQSENGEKNGLNMVFEVVGEVSTPDGHVLMREIATQTHPPQKYIRIDGKDSEPVPALEVTNDDNPLQPDGKRFKCKSEETRDVHQRCHKDSMRDYYCCFCDFSAPQWTKMHMHLFKHGVEKPYKCDQCSFTCKNKSDLTSHMAVHSNLKQFQCPKCKRLYKHRRNVVAHLRTCSGVDETGKPQKIDSLEKYVCKVCNRKLSTKKNLDKHMEIHTNIKPFECKTCGHKTRLKESLLMHERLHTGEKPFKCSICNYATPDRSSLRRHMRTHTKEKPYKCKFCPYSCIQKHCLDTHVRRKHTGEQFVCGLCHYATHDRYGLNQHFKRHQNCDPSVSQNNLRNATEGSQSQTNASFLNVVEDAGTTYIGLPSSGMLKSTTEINKLGESSQIKSLSNPVILRIAHATTLDTDLQLGSASTYSEKGVSVTSEDSGSCSIDMNRPQEDSVELAQIEATLVQQIQQPGDEVFVQPTGEIIIKREDGHLLVIQRRDDMDNDVDLEAVGEQEYYAAVPLSDISPDGHGSACDAMDGQPEELRVTSTDQKLEDEIA